jgi:hypothetical protein
MAFVNYSVPDDVKELFNLTFKGRNKSALIAELMQQAINHELRQRVHVTATEAILRRGESTSLLIVSAANDVMTACK